MMLYAFHQGAYKGGQLFYSVFDGTKWQPDTQVQNVGGMGASPAAVVWNGNPHVFHQGGDSDVLIPEPNGELWYAYFDGTNWYDIQVQNVGMSESPSAVAYGGNLYVFHQGGYENGELYYSVFDGANWHPDTQVPNVGMSESPSAVAYGGNLYVFHQGGYENGELYYSVFDGANWHPDTQVPNVGMSESPSAVAYGGNLYVFHQGGSQNGELYYSVFDGAQLAPRYAGSERGNVGITLGGSLER